MNSNMFLASDAHHEHAALDGVPSWEVLYIYTVRQAILF